MTTPKPKVKAMRGVEAEKICSHCHRRLPFSSFWGDITRYDGRGHRCKECATEATLSWHSRRKIAERQRRSYAKHRAKALARVKLNDELKAGKIQKGSCLFEEQCTGRIEGHHLLYDFPFIVIWLCVKHHSAVHHLENTPLTPKKKR